MSEQKYRLEENNQTNELILWEDIKILNVFKNSYDNRKHLNIIVDRLNEQQEHITHLEDTNDNFRIKLIEDIEAMEQAEKKIGEQQEIIKESNEQVLNILNENEKLKKEIEFWKKWALEYLTDYPIYSDTFLDTIKEIEGEGFIEATKKKQNEIIEILKKENLW